MLRDVIGTLPSGEPLTRTRAGGPASAPVLALGVYPAVTATFRWTHDGLTRLLPKSTEATSFAPGSASGRAVDAHLLDPLGLGRDDVAFTDLWPWLLANTRRAQSGRSMADNVAAWEAATGQTTGLEPRPDPDVLVRRVRDDEAQCDRLRAELAGRRLLLTLGLEPAAFVRGVRVADLDPGEVLYAPPERLTVLDQTLDVVHLAHPAWWGREARWSKTHAFWASFVGPGVIASSCP